MVIENSVRNCVYAAQHGFEILRMVWRGSPQCLTFLPCHSDLSPALTVKTSLRTERYKCKTTYGKTNKKDK